jgi:hypothetical protein
MRTTKLDDSRKTDIVKDINQYKNGHPHIQLAKELPLQVESSLSTAELCLNVLRGLLRIRFFANMMMIGDGMAHGRRVLKNIRSC